MTLWGDFCTRWRLEARYWTLAGEVYWFNNPFNKLQEQRSQLFPSRSSQDHAGGWSIGVRPGGFIIAWRNTAWPVHSRLATCGKKGGKVRWWRLWRLWSKCDCSGCPSFALVPFGTVIKAKLLRIVISIKVFYTFCLLKHPPVSSGESLCQDILIAMNINWLHTERVFLFFLAVFITLVKLTPA